MDYYHSKILKGTSFDQAIQRVTTELQNEGFGILTEIDVSQTLKKKLNVDFSPYKILGACNPAFAYQALKAENKIGTMLPCNVIIQQAENDDIEVSVVDPIKSMQAVNNEGLGKIATEIRGKLLIVLNRI